MRLPDTPEADGNASMASAAVGSDSREYRRLTVDQMKESLAAEEVDLNLRISDRDHKIKTLERENSEDRARRRTVKRLLTAVKGRDRTAPAKPKVKP